MKKLSLLLITVLVLTFCTSCTEGEEKVPKGTNANHTVVDLDGTVHHLCDESTEKVLKIFNWGDYIDFEVIDEFEEKTGYTIIYDTFDTNESMYAKMKADPTGYDLIFPSEYMAKRMIEEGYISKLDFDNIPNISMIDTKFRGLSYDPTNEYTVPYTWGTLGILYNKEMVTEPIKSWDILWDKKYSKNIFMMNSSRDSMAVALKKLGYSLNTTNDRELKEAKDLLIRQKPLVLAYLNDEIKDKMVSGEAALALSYSGNALEVVAEYPEYLDYVVPTEQGTNWFVDVVCIMETSKHKKTAEEFINFLCETDIATRNCDYIRYSTPHLEAIEEMKEIDYWFATNPNAFPEDVSNMELFISNDIINKKYDRLWLEVRAK